MDFRPIISRVKSISQDAFMKKRSDREPTKMKGNKCMDLKRRLQHQAANRLQNRCNIMFQHLNKTSPHRKPRVQLEDNTGFITLRLPLVFPRPKIPVQQVGNEYAVKEERSNVTAEPKKDAEFDLWEKFDTVESEIEPLPDNEKDTAATVQQDMSLPCWYKLPDEDPSTDITTSQENTCPCNENEPVCESEFEYKFDTNQRASVDNDKSTAFTTENQKDMQSAYPLSSLDENPITTRDPPILQGNDDLSPRHKSCNPRPHGIYCQRCFKYLPINGHTVAVLLNVEPIAMKEHIKRCHPKETATDISYIRSYSHCPFGTVLTKCPCGYEMPSRKRHFSHFKGHHEKYVDSSTELVYCSICAEIFHKDYFDIHITTDHKPTGMIPVSGFTNSKFCTICQTKPGGSLAAHLYRHRVGTLSISTRPSSFVDKPHYCCVCGALFPFYRLKEHYDIYHPSDDVRSFEFSGDIPKCQICSCGTPTLLALYKHLQSHLK